MDGVLGAENFSGLQPNPNPNRGVERTVIREYLGYLMRGSAPASPERGMCLGSS